MDLKTIDAIHTDLSALYKFSSIHTDWFLYGIHVFELFFLSIRIIKVQQNLIFFMIFRILIFFVPEIIII